ncbi:MAG: cysteine--tRNA ligase, partial [Deltaproteobacteria bacterium]
RPGWHIECSALSMRYLGETFDIHGGGRDLIFPHHENEIAQSEAATGRPLARYWIHNGLVTVNKQKMAKSLGNFYLIHDLVQRFSPLVVRYTILTNHYTSNVDFNPQAYRQAYKRLDYFYSTLEKIDRFIETTPQGSDEVLDPERVSAIERGFVEAMDDDFNTAAAIASLSEPFRYANELLAARKPKGKERVATLRRIREALTRVGEVLGLFQDPPAEVLRRLHDDLARELEIDTAWVEATIAERDAARKGKDWKRADELRERLAERGIALLDTPTGTTWKVDLSHFPETP